MHAIRLVSISVGALLFSQVATNAADAAHGLDLAQRWCASCHVVSPAQKRASADVPPFATIARSPDFDAKRLAYFLLEPHPKMPQMALSRLAADDIAAYIKTLRK
jgi:mono/diheme cytochrome c family protein